MVPNVSFFMNAFLWILHIHNKIDYFTYYKCAIAVLNVSCDLVCFLTKPRIYYLKITLEVSRDAFSIFYIFPLVPSQIVIPSSVSSHIMRPITTLPSWFWKTLKADRNAVSGRAEVIRPRCFVLTEPQMVLEVMKRFMVSYRRGEWSCEVLEKTLEHMLLGANFLLKHFII